MAKAKKTSTSVAKVNPSKVAEVSKGWFIQDLPGGKQTVGLTDKYKDFMLTTTAGLGGLIRTFEEKRVELTAIALNVNEMFTEYKRLTKKGLPSFVCELFDPTCPDKYGAVGTDDRKEIVQHARFRGFEALIKRANAELKIQATRKALIDAGVNPDEADKVKDHNKEKREETIAKQTALFVQCMVDIGRHGLTETTVSNVIMRVLGKVDKEDELTDAGDALLQATLKELTRKALLKPVTE